MIFMCGIPKVKIFGTKEDWGKIRNSCTEIANLIPELTSYMENVKNVTEKIEESDKDFLSDIFSTKKLGSGQQLELNGWIKDLYIDNSIRNIENYPTSVSSIKYKEIVSGIEMRIHTGLLSCKEDEDYLVPEFGYIIENLSNKDS